MIGKTVKQLLDAAVGKMPAKSYAEQPTDAESQYKSALQRRSTLLPTAQERTEIGGLQQGAANITGGLVGDIYGMERLGRSPQANVAPTSTYGELVKGLARARGGLDTDKGKYGGFYSAGDLQSAIEGSAIGFRERSTEDLRREALKRYAAIDQMYQEAISGARRTELRTMGFKPTAPSSAAGARMFEEVTSLNPKPLREYAGTLGKWYEEQAKPAEEYLQTAQQIETTPLSKLAESIAVSQYGMNPDLAASKFRGLDQQYWQNRRNERYMEDYGIPYDEYMAQIAEGERQQRQEQQGQEFAVKQAAQDIENLTGFKSSALSGLTGQSPTQIYSTLVDQKGNQRIVQYKDPATDQDVQQSAAGLINTVREYLNSDDREGLSAILNSLRSVGKQEDIARLIAAMMYIGGVKQENINLDLNLAGYLEQ